MKFWLASEDQTRAAGAALADDLLPLTNSDPVVVFVRGNLGAGKSTFVRGFLTQTGITGVMPSPTYSLVEPYQTDRLNVFHMDAYRIADGAELDYLGLDDIDRPGTILLVEWPDHVQAELPTPTVTVDLEMSPCPEDSCPEAPRVDRHNSYSRVDRHNSGKASDSLSPKPHEDRHGSGKTSDSLSVDRHNDESDSKNWAKTADFAELGRLLTLTAAETPSAQGALIKSRGWRDLFKVVT